MNKLDQKKDYKEKIKLLDKYNKFYYQKSRPLVSDYEYDKLKNEILFLESNYKYLKSDISPSKKIGYRALWKGNHYRF